MSWLSDFYRTHPEYRRLRVARRSACSIHFEIEPPTREHGGVYQAFFQIRPIYSRVHHALWMPQSLLADAARLVVAAIRNPLAAAQFAAGLPLATVLALPPGDRSSGVDTLLRGTAADTNYGTLGYFGCGNYDGTTNQRVGLINFDLTSLPSAVIVSSAVITFVCGQVRQLPASPTNSFKAFRVLRAWSETQATWNVYSTGNAWTTSGCRGAGTDRAAATIWTGSMSLSSVGDSQTFTLDLTEFGNLRAANNGIVFDAVDSTTLTGIYYPASAENTTASYRPLLTVTYTLPAGGAPIQQPFAAAFRGPFG